MGFCSESECHSCASDAPPPLPSSRTPSSPGTLAMIVLALLVAFTVLADRFA